MKTINIEGKLRTEFGSSPALNMRKEGWVPCELYGAGQANVHFCVYEPDLKDLVYTNHSYVVNIDVEGTKHSAIMGEIQFHPVNEAIRHIDFIAIDATKPVKVSLPINYTGNSQGVKEGGKLVKTLMKLSVRGKVSDLPETIDVDVTALGMGKSIKVRELIAPKNVEILNSPANPVASVSVPRAMKDAVAAAAAEAGKK